MTGFTFLCQLVRHGHLPQEQEFAENAFHPDGLETADLVNRIYLVSKNIPLLLQKSEFAKLSLSHVNKYKAVMADCYNS